RIDGERAYQKAHRGEQVELPPSRVYLHSARFGGSPSQVTLVCRGGYYVRSFARDLGRALGCGAHVTTLRRTRIGLWSDTVALAEVVRARALLPWLPSREISDAEAAALRRGEALKPSRLAPPEWPLPDN